MEEEEQERVDEESEELLQAWESSMVGEKSARAKEQLRRRGAKPKNFEKRKGAKSQPGRRKKKL